MGLTALAFSGYMARTTAFEARIYTKKLMQRNVQIVKKSAKNDQQNTVTKNQS